MRRFTGQWSRGRGGNFQYKTGRHYALKDWERPRWRTALLLVENARLRPGADGADFRIANYPVGRAPAVSRVELLALSPEQIRLFERRTEALETLHERQTEALGAHARALDLCAQAWKLGAEQPAEADARELAALWDAFFREYDHGYYDAQLAVVDNDAGRVEAWGRDLLARLQRLGAATAGTRARMQAAIAERIRSEAGVPDLPGPAPGGRALDDRVIFSAWIDQLDEKWYRLIKLLGCEATFRHARFAVDRDGKSTVPPAEQPWLSRVREDGAHGILSEVATSHSFQLVPGWLIEACGKDVGRPRGRAPNLFHEGVRQYYRLLLRELGRLTRDDANVFMIRTQWEGRPRDGYDAQAQPAFAAYLREKYGEIRKLNQRWGTNHGDFSEIEMLAKPARQDRKRPRPQHFEQAMFREVSYSDFCRFLYETARESNPGKLIHLDTCAYIQGGPVHEYLCGAHCDVHGTHIAWDIYETAVNTYSIDQWQGGARPLANGELNAGFPEIKMGCDERAISASFNNSYWDEIVLGKRLLTNWVLGVANGWGMGPIKIQYAKRTGALAERGELFHPHFGAVPLMKEKADRYAPLLARSKIVGVDCAFVVPTASVIHADLLPYNFHQFYLFHQAPKWLYPWNDNFFYVPDFLLAERPEILDRFKVVVVGCAPFLAQDAVASLLAFAAKGGGVIALGPLGLHDELGRPTGRLYTELFGGLERTADCRLLGRGEAFDSTALQRLAAFDDIDRGGRALQDWHWPVRVGNRDAVLASLTDGSDMLLETQHGRGRVFLSHMSMERNCLRSVFRAKLREYRPLPEAQAFPGKSLVLTLREDRAGVRWLFARAVDTHRPTRALVQLKGSYGDLLDYEAGAGAAPVAAESRDGLTTFWLRLRPGAFAAIRLGERSAPDAPEQALLAGSRRNRQTALATVLPFGPHSPAEPAAMVREAVRKAEARVGSMSGPAAALAKTMLAVAQWHFAGNAVRDGAVYLRMIEAGAPPAAVRYAAPATVRSARTAAPVEIDAALDEWAQAAPSESGLTPAGLRRWSVRSLWDDRFLYLALEFRNLPGLKVNSLMVSLGGLERHSSLTTRFAVMHYGDADFRLRFGGGGSFIHAERWFYPNIMQVAPRGIRSAASHTEDGWAMEAAIPLEEVFLFPTPGHAVRFNVNLSLTAPGDLAGQAAYLGDEKYSVFWSDDSRSIEHGGDTNGWGRLVFAGEAPEPR